MKKISLNDYLIDIQYDKKYDIDEEHLNILNSFRKSMPFGITNKQINMIEKIKSKFHHEVEIDYSNVNIKESYIYNNEVSFDGSNLVVSGITNLKETQRVVDSLFPCKISIFRSNRNICIPFVANHLDNYAELLSTFPKHIVHKNLDNLLDNLCLADNTKPFWEIENNKININLAYNFDLMFLLAPLNIFSGTYEVNPRLLNVLNILSSWDLIESKNSEEILFEKISSEELHNNHNIIILNEVSEDLFFRQQNHQIQDISVKISSNFLQGFNIYYHLNNIRLSTTCLKSIENVLLSKSIVKPYKNIYFYTYYDHFKKYFKNYDNAHKFLGIINETKSNNKNTR